MLVVHLAFPLSSSVVVNQHCASGWKAEVEVTVRRGMLGSLLGLSVYLEHAEVLI